MLESNNENVCKRVLTPVTKRQYGNYQLLLVCDDSFVSFSKSRAQSTPMSVLRQRITLSLELICLFFRSIALDLSPDWPTWLNGSITLWSLDHCLYVDDMVTGDLPTLASISFHGRRQVMTIAVSPFVVPSSGTVCHAVCWSQTSLTTFMNRRKTFLFAADK